MGKNVFISYKYKDEKVHKLADSFNDEVDGKTKLVVRNTRVRDYVDLMQEKIGKEHTNLGEKDGESLEDFSDEKIESELKKKIYRSSVTIVVISKGMKDTTLKESEQWIPWEISYSLRVVNREDSTSQMNAVLGVVLPDENNSYDWYYTENKQCNCTTHHTQQLFKILSKNMFNIKEKTFRECNGIKIHTTSDSSFIKTVKWSEFMNGSNYDFYINKAVEIREKANLYEPMINLE